jgi:hypothetical protein
LKAQIDEINAIVVAAFGFGTSGACKSDFLIDLPDNEEINMSHALAVSTPT